MDIIHKRTYRTFGDACVFDFRDPAAFFRELSLQFPPCLVAHFQGSTLSFQLTPKSFHWIKNCVDVQQCFLLPEKWVTLTLLIWSCRTVKAASLQWKPFFFNLWIKDTPFKLDFYLPSYLAHSSFSFLASESRTYLGVMRLDELSFVVQEVLF